MNLKQASDAVVLDELVDELVTLGQERRLQLHHQSLRHPPAKHIDPVQRTVHLGKKAVASGSNSVLFSKSISIK